MVQMEIRKLSEALQNKANIELNEVTSRIPEDIEHIREWLKKQPHLSIRTDDQHLLSFLRGCKFSLQKTKEKLDFYYSIRTIAPELYGNRDPLLPEINLIFQTCVTAILPQSTNTLEAPIFVFRYKGCDPQTMSMANIFKTCLMIMDLAMNEDDDLIVSGLRFIIDFDEFGASYAMQFTPDLFKKFLLSLQNAYPARIKAIYAINAPVLFDTIYAIGKPFMSNKFKSRMQVFRKDNIKKFYEEIPQHELPMEYGGDLPSIAYLAKQWKTKCESCREWFLENDKYYSDETLRSDSSKHFLYDKLNMEGSFRKLTID